MKYDNNSVETNVGGVVYRSVPAKSLCEGCDLFYMSSRFVGACLSAPNLPCIGLPPVIFKKVDNEND